MFTILVARFLEQNTLPTALSQSTTGTTSVWLRLQGMVPLLLLLPMLIILRILLLMHTMLLIKMMRQKLVLCW